MSDEEHPPNEGAQNNPEPPPQSQEIRHSQVSALVPKGVARGVFSTGAVVLQGAHEFIIDFLLRMTMPHQVAARVVMPPAVLGRFIAALRENLGNFQRTFQNAPLPGVTEIDTANIPAQSQPVTTPAGNENQATSAAGDPSGQESTSLSQNSVQDLYDQLKMSDEMLSGVYANAVMIGHTASEFSFDFITTFFPRSAVSSRVYMSAGNVPRFLSSITHAFEQFQKKVQQQQAQQRPTQPPDADPPPPPPHPENDG
ncbi:MAG: DUF3467 domain-containing protein [Planctomycetaceae bacterium]|nr:DUF3467 domain-containing protein [Planctomycetaceae bacterium]